MRKTKKRLEEYWWIIPVIIIISLIGTSLFSIVDLEDVVVLQDTLNNGDTMGVYSTKVVFLLSDASEPGLASNAAQGFYVYIPDLSKIDPALPDRIDIRYYPESVGGRTPDSQFFSGCMAEGITCKRIETWGGSDLYGGIYINDVLAVKYNHADGEWKRTYYPVGYGNTIKAIRFKRGTAADQIPSNIADCQTSSGILICLPKTTSPSEETIPVQTIPPQQPPQDTSQQQPPGNQTIITKEKPSIWMIAAPIFLILIGLIIFLSMKILKRIR